MKIETEQELTAIHQFSSIKNALVSLFGEHIQITRTDRISGGDINKAYRLTLSDGSDVFMKCNTKENLPFFKAEIDGLAAISKTGTIGTPQILCYGTDDENGGCSFLLLQHIMPINRIQNYWEVFARQLADMHNAPTKHFAANGFFGFSHNNFIGSRNQINTPCSKFITFFRDYRLAPQFDSAAEYFNQNDRKKISHLLDHLEDFLAEPEHPSLLHGDLWSGNIITGNDGKIWLIDPAAYVGHAEADLAMTELFGGFPQSFYAAYREVSPLQPGYEHRRELYNLYHLLNHLNIFGMPYLSSVKRTIEKYAG